MYDKQALIEIIRRKALKFGQFTLASGKQATYYLDGKQVTLDPQGARLVAEGILDLLAGGVWPAAVGGMSIGADPITAAVVTMSAVRGTPLAGFMVRKEPKGHGTNRYLEGPVQPGSQVVIVEDVVTTGGSSLQAIERCEAFGLKIAQVLAIVDRMEGGAASLRRPGLFLRQPADDPRLRHRAAGVSGEWRVGSGEWRVASGEWRVVSGEWGVVSGEWGVASAGGVARSSQLHSSYRRKVGNPLRRNYGKIDVEIGKSTLFPPRGV